MKPAVEIIVNTIIESKGLRAKDTAGDLIDHLIAAKQKKALEHVRELMCQNEYLTRSSLIYNFLRDIREVYQKGKS